MTLKDILVLLDSNSQAAGAYAVSLASIFDANLTAAAVVVDPTTSMALVDTPTTFLAAALEEARTAARQLLTSFERQAQQSGVSIDTEPVETAVGTTGQALGPLARHFDIAIVEQPDPDVPAEREMMIEAALFGSGRPVLIVPYIQKPPFRLESVLVAWDGSATAARALADAMPFLERSKRIEVVMAAGDAEDAEATGIRLQRHLARHGVEAEFRRISGAGGDVAGALLSHAFDAGADVMVMGGYGHSRFRELILGGATRGVLGAMTLPVLMSH
jgi:nucleotide-binding universal stress UspA family protein